MPSFKIEEVEPVEYDFRPMVDAHGVIPEPTEGQIRSFVHGIAAYTGEDVSNLSKAAEAAQDGEDQSEEERSISGWKMMENMADHRDEANKAVAELCSNRPSVEEVAKLPFRLFMQFLGYLQESIINPEAPGGDSTEPTPETTRPPISPSERSSDSPSQTPTPSREPSTSSSVAG